MRENFAIVFETDKTGCFMYRAAIDISSIPVY